MNNETLRPRIENYISDDKTQASQVDSILSHIICAKTFQVIEEYGLSYTNNAVYNEEITNDIAKLIIKKENYKHLSEKTKEYIKLDIVSMLQLKKQTLTEKNYDILAELYSSLLKFYIEKNAQ